MSINLHLQDGPDGPEIGLWQTPTHITQICLSVNPVDGKPDGGHEAVRRRYLCWVDSEMNGTYESEEDLRWMRSRVKEHRNQVLAVKNPYFFCI
jgi:hypothetical protein